MKYYITINWKYSEINNVKIRNIIIMITKMITMTEKEIIATKKSWLIIENGTARNLQQFRFKNPAKKHFFISKVFLVATFNTFPFLLLSL